MNKRIMLAAVLSVGIILGVTMVSLGRQDKAPEDAGQAPQRAAQPVEVVTAELGTIQDVGEYTGTFEAEDEVDVVPEVPGKVTAVYYDVGDEVKKGAVLVRLDTEITAAQRDQAAAAVALAKARLEQAKHGPELQRTVSETQVEQARQQVAAAQARVEQAQKALEQTGSATQIGISQAQINLETAEANLREVKRGARDQQRAQALAAVEQAEAGFKLAETNYKIRKRLYTQGAISGTKYGEALAYYQTTKAQLEQARQAYSLIQEGPTTDQVRMAEDQVRQAKEQLRLAEANQAQVAIREQDLAAARTQLRQAEEALRMAEANAVQVQIRQEDIEAAEAGVAQAEASRRAAAAAVNKATILAPISGLVALRMIDPGEMAGGSNAVFRLVNIDVVYLLAQVTELGITRIRKGLRAALTIDGVPGYHPTGVVTEVYPASVPQQRLYIAKVKLENRDHRVRPGMFGRARVLFGERKAALVDRDAVVIRDKISYVYRVVRGKIERVEVKVGGEQDGKLEIVSGVSPGDVLVATGQSDLDPGDRVVPKHREATAAGNS